MKKIISLLLTITTLVTLLIVPVSGIGDKSVTVSTEKEFLDALEDSENVEEIVLRGGTYRFSNEINIENRSEKLKIKSYSGEVAVLTNSVELDGWTECTINGVKTFVTDAKGMKLPTLFSTENDVHIARLPETGFYYLTEADPTDHKGKDDYCRYNAFYASDLKAEPSNVKDVTINILHSWVNDILSMVSYDADTNRVLMNKYTGRPIEAQDRYFLENVIESLDKSGEWCFDTTQDKIYYVPYSGETADNLEMYVSDDAEFIKITNSADITFENVKIADTGWTYSDEKYVNTDIHQRTMGYSVSSYQGGNDVCGAVTVTYSQNINFVNCEFENIGCTAIKYYDGAKHCTAENCYFENIGSSAFYIGGKFYFDKDAVNDPKNYAEDITVKNCEIYKYGQRFSGSCGIILTYCDTADISNNEIHDGYYSGISVGFTWLFFDNPTENITVKDNLIYDIGNHTLSDLGGIYLLGVQQGTVVSGNVIHDVTMYDGSSGYAGNGIYLDSGCQYMTIENNLVFNCDTSGFNTTLSKENVIRNNIFALCGESTACLGTAQYAKAFLNLNSVFNNNIFLTDNHVMSVEYLQNTEHFKGNGNIIWDMTYGSDTYYAEGHRSGKTLTMETAKNKGYLDSVVFMNPEFTDAKGFDFSFSEDSEIKSTGFKPFDYTKAGTIKNTTIGINHEGGLTQYNGSAESVTSRPSELSFFVKIGKKFTDLFNLFKSLLKGIFGIKNDEKSVEMITSDFEKRSGNEYTEEIAELYNEVKKHNPTYYVDESRKPFADDDRIQAIFFDGEKYNGNDTKIFAYIGFPEGASATEKVPAVVLVHGGGVYAQADWVKYWVDRGYAAIAIDGMCHQHKVGEYIPSHGIEDWEDNPNAHAPFSDFKDLDNDISQQWFYFFVSDIILANNLIRNDERVNSNLVGVAGISWGGYATSVVIGYDQRFAFAIPIYGTGYTDKSTADLSSVFGSKACEIWEPSLTFENATMPVMFLNGNNDPFFSADTTNASAANVEKGNLTLYTGINHGYFRFEESIRFANEITGIGNGNIHINKATENNGKVYVDFTTPSDVSNVKLKIVYRTTPLEYDGLKLKEEWIEKSGTIIDGEGVVSVPKNATMYYIKVEGKTGTVFDKISVCATTGITVKN